MTREVPGAMINGNLFTQVNQDSGSLTSATTVVHRFAEQGEYRGVLIDRRGVATGEFSIIVGEEKRPEHQEGGHEAALPTSVQVDLTGLQASSLSAVGQAGYASGDDGCGCDDEGQTGTMRVAPGGYAVFKVPAGAAGGYAVELYKSGESGRGKKVFDSASSHLRDGLTSSWRAKYFSPISWSAGGKRCAVELTGLSASVVKYFQVASLKHVGT